MAHRVAFVVAPGFELLDLAGPLCAFRLADQLHGARYDAAVASVDGGPVSGCAGVQLGTEGRERVVRADTVVVVGGPDAHLRGRQPDTVALLASLAGGGRRIASVCTGAFYLAEAGLLDGRRATTHWRWAPLLRSAYPSIRVEADRIHISDGGVWTSAGITAGIDLSLALIEADHGPELSRAVARDMVVYHRRVGGQSQFSTILDLEPASDRVRTALAYARDHLGEDLSVERLAGAACLSVRQFSRLFAMETGETPARAVERLRVEAIRPGVEDGGRALETLAREVGFRDAGHMRGSFLRVLGRSPQALRRASRDHLRFAG